MSLDKGKIPEIDAASYRFAIVAARYNKELVDALVRDTITTFSNAGVDAENVRLVRVPGSAELPHVCSMLAQTNEYDAIVALGVVVAGETPHHMIIANSTAQALQSVALETTVPVINGIIVANSREQAEARTTGKIARGVEFGEAAIEMACQTSILLDELIEAEDRNAEDDETDIGDGACGIFDADDDIDCDCPNDCECGGSCCSPDEADNDGFLDESNHCHCSGECSCGHNGHECSCGHGDHECSCGGECSCSRDSEKLASKVSSNDISIKNANKKKKTAAKKTSVSKKSVSKKVVKNGKIAPKKIASKSSKKNNGRGRK